MKNKKKGVCLKPSDEFEVIGMLAVAISLLMFRDLRFDLLLILPFVYLSRVRISNVCFFFLIFS